MRDQRSATDIEGTGFKLLARNIYIYIYVCVCVCVQQDTQSVLMSEFIQHLC